MKKSSKIEITEIFMAKAGRHGWDRCFHGTIKRLRDENDVPYVFSRIKVNDGYIIAQAACQEELGSRLDEIVLMVLDEGLHDDQGVTSLVAGFKCLLN